MDEAILRLEAKVDRLTDAVTKLILVEERLSTQGERLGRVEQHLAALDVVTAKTDKKVDQWINRGMGVWAVVVTIFAVGQAAFTYLK